MLWGGVSEPYTERFKAGERKLNKKQSSSKQEALSKATLQTPRATDSTFHMRHRLITRTLAAMDSCLVLTTIHPCIRAARQEPGSNLNQSRIWEKGRPLSSPPFRSERLPIIGWFNNRARTPVDGGARKSNN